MIPSKAGVAAVIPEQMETSSASIAMTPEMFSMLSDKMYTNKIRAVIREISCNASDAMIAAGKADQPIQVHLPTRFEQWFSVKDEGLGLTHEQVMNLYLTYGASTKTDTNTQVGGFGIGSKSCFAYTEAFTVESVKDSKRSIYSIYRDEGIPKVTCLSTTDTLDPNSVEVKMPVKAQDIYEFEHEGKYVYSFFDVKPILNKEVSYKEVEETSVEGLYEAYETLAVMGQVAYEFPLSQLKEDLEELLGRFHLHFDIGEISPAPSREQLSNDTKTQKAIAEKLEKCILDFITKNQVELDKKSTVKEALDYFSSLRTTVSSRITWKGYSKNDVLEQHLQNLEDFFQSLKSIQNNFYVVERDWYGYTPKVVNKFADKEKLDSSFFRNEKVLILIEDTKGAITPFKEALKKAGKRTIGLVFQDEKEAEVFEETFEENYVRIFKASELKEKKVKKKARDLDTVVLYTKHLSGGTTNKAVKIDLDNIKKDVYYVVKNRDYFNFRGSYCKEQPRYIYNFFAFSNTVFSLLPEQVRAFKKAGINLIQLDTVIDNYIKPTDDRGSKIEFFNGRLTYEEFKVGKTSKLLSQEYIKEYYKSKLTNYLPIEGTKAIVPAGDGRWIEEVKKFKEELEAKYDFLQAFKKYSSRVEINTTNFKYIQYLIEGREKGLI